MVIKGGDHGLDLWMASAAGKTGWRRGCHVRFLREETEDLQGGMA